MTTPNSFPTLTGQPSLQDLTARFLAAKAAAGGEVEDAGDVVPHEVAGGFRAPARLTWDEALLVFRLFGVEAEKLASPPEWAAFANLETAGIGVPLAAGLFPQRFRLVPGSLSAAPLTRPTAAGPQPGLPALSGWVKKALRSQSKTTLLVAAGIAACLGDHASADAALAAAEELCHGAWRPVWENQRTAVLWLRGEYAEAAKAWDVMTDRPATVFNRGLASLFSGTAATDQLNAAAASLPKESGWSHLAKLYVTLAAARGK